MNCVGSVAQVILVTLFFDPSLWFYDGLIMYNNGEDYIKELNNKWITLLDML